MARPRMARCCIGSFISLPRPVPGRRSLSSTAGVSLMVHRIVHRNQSLAPRIWPRPATLRFRSNIDWLLPALCPARLPMAVSRINPTTLNWPFAPHASIRVVTGRSAGLVDRPAVTWLPFAVATGTPGDDRLDFGVSLSGAYDLSDFSPNPHLAIFTAKVTNYVNAPSTDTAALARGLAGLARRFEQSRRYSWSTASRFDALFPAGRYDHSFGFLGGD